MNICLLTARVIESPKRIFHNNQYLTEFTISFPHLKKKLCCTTVICSGKMSQEAFDLYYLGDYIILEGRLLIKKSPNQKFKLVIKIINLHPAHIFINKW
uniref:Putative single-stranded DNA binding protein n=1 Tax=Rhodogorgon sp. TaxID=2485824 RepID=A0A3G3MI54_9FLOR|nr:putative single-stranded DNA binding protein [Rhodogorgon sp.]